MQDGNSPQFTVDSPQPCRRALKWNKWIYADSLRYHDNKSHETQVAYSERIASVAFAVSMVCYIDRKPVFRILCGSI